MVSLLMWICIAVPPADALSRCWAEGWCGGVETAGMSASREEACGLALSLCSQEYNVTCSVERVEKGE
jgi:hypothetical protein